MARVWRSESSRDGQFLSVAYPQWEIVISRIAGKLHIVLRGAETVATQVGVPGNGSWIGLRFRSGAVMSAIDFVRLRDSAITLPVVGRNRFWLAGRAWEVPTFENADDFVAHLARCGLVRHDPVVLASRIEPISDKDGLRRQQRHFIKATGLSKQAIATIERAQRAALMLRNGLSINDTVTAAGFSDQSHLTRSLTRLIGITPAQLLSKCNEVQLSFIPKPDPDRASGPTGADIRSAMSFSFKTEGFCPRILSNR